jgi:Tol biopolymer transport system component
MHKRYPTLIRALALAAVFAVLSSTNVYAQKKPGGGGGGGDTTPVPPGTIHFSQSTADSWYYADMTMKADGSAKTQIGLREQGNWLEPSYQLHGGHRWFLNTRDTGVTNWELFASTADGDLVPVMNHADLGIASIRWARNDSFLSFVGYSYNSTIDEYEEDLYVADVEWISDRPVFGEPRKVLSLGYSDTSIALGAYDWSPAGDELVYEDWSFISGDIEIRVARFLESGEVETRYLGNGWIPTWSPDGNWIAYGKGGIWKIRPDGSGLVQLTTLASGQSHTDQVWSPDSLHLAFTQKTTTTTTKRGVTTTTSTYDILRIPATGGTATNLTTDTAADCWSIGWR